MNTKLKIFILILLLGVSLSAQDLDSLSATSAILVDYSTGRILFEKNAEMPFPPASMTKLVTLYLTYSSIEAGEHHKSEPVEITATGSSFSRPPRSSLMMLEEGQKVDLLTIMKGVAISSGNDGAYQLAELIGGSVENFVQEMNRLMQKLDLPHMHFVDPDGWSEDNLVTAREYAEFASEYIHRYPEALEELHSITSLSYPMPENFPDEGGGILWTRTKNNTNSLLNRVEGVDGLKTGYIDESGFNFTATAKRGETRLISVVMGIFPEYYSQGVELRARETAALLEYGFSHWSTAPAPWEDTSLLTWFGTKDQVRLEPVFRPPFTLTEEERNRLWTLIELRDPLVAPVPEGLLCGEIFWYLDGNLLGQSNLVTEEEIQQGSFKDNLQDIISIITYKITSGRKQ